jgi:hypothetical protein
MGFYLMGPRMYGLDILGLQLVLGLGGYGCPKDVLTWTRDTMLEQRKYENFNT